MTEGCTATPPGENYVCETHFFENGKEYHLFHNPKADIKNPEEFATAFIKTEVSA